MALELLTPLVYIDVILSRKVHLIEIEVLKSQLEPIHFSALHLVSFVSEVVPKHLLVLILVLIIDLLRYQLDLALDLRERLCDLLTVLACCALLSIGVLVEKLLLLELIVAVFLILLQFGHIHEVLLRILRRSKVH